MKYAKSKQTKFTNNNQIPINTDDSSVNPLVR